MVSTVTSKYEEWLTEFIEVALPGERAAFIGVCVLTRPDLHDRLKLKPELAADATCAYYRTSEGDAES